MKVSAKKLPILMSKILKAGITPFIHSSPALGKSDIVKQLADKYKLKLIDLRLSQSDPTDMLGMPFVNKEENKAGYMPMNTFPIEGDPIPENYKGWCLFLDEMNSAPLSVQAAAFKLVLDKQVGEFKLHKNVAIICAGNLATDKGIVNRLSTPMQSRLAHFELVPDIKAWIAWADKSNIDHRIKSYLQHKPKMLYNFNPKHNDHTFASPRTWEFASKLINSEPLTDDSIILLSSVISEGVAREFYSYTAIYRDIPSIEEIIDNPERAKVVKQPANQFALSGMISDAIDEKNAKPLMTYLNRLDIEFQVIAVQAMVAKNDDLLEQEDVVDWKTEHIDLLAS